MNELKQVESISNMTLKELETGVKITKETLKTMATILESITKFSSSVNKNNEYVNDELFRYMKEGNEPNIVEIPLDEVEKMSEKLDNKEISFLVYQLDNKGIFFTKTEDSEQVQQLALQTQLESHHFSEISLETIVAAYNGEQLGGIYGLDSYMVTQFQKNVEAMSSEKTKFLTYAIQLDSDSGNGSYSILFHSEFFSEARTVYTKSAIELGGPAGDVYKSRIDKEKELEDPHINTEELDSKKKRPRIKKEILTEQKNEKNEAYLIEKSEQLLALYERKLSLDNGEQNEVWSSFINGEVSFNEFFELEQVNDQHDEQEKDLARKYAKSVYTTFHQGAETMFDIPKNDENVQELYEYLYQEDDVL